MPSTGANCNNKPVNFQQTFFTRSTYKLNETQKNSSSCKLQLEGTHLASSPVFLRASCDYWVRVGLIAVGGGAAALCIYAHAREMHSYNQEACAG